MDEVVTLLHGFTLAGASWDDLVSRMPSGWKWLTPDLRSTTMDDCAADLVEMWDHLGVERSHVVGYSMGGRLALHVAVRLPERTRSLFTIGAHAGLDPAARAERRVADEALAQRIEREGVEAFVTYWEGLPMFAGIARRGPRFLAWLHAMRVANTADGLAASLRGMGAGAMEPLWEMLDAVTCPSTFIAGERDPVFVSHAQRLAEEVAGSRVQIVAGSGHSVQFEQPDVTAAILADHLSGAAAATSSSTTA
ncbi:MAG TPA: alpha/beta fold hydrolase [Candidatus Dormibacteraeota bacterium]|nr:alpha/beta fold hydrolase [Candidatus Dormibacteraeota bacterium]